MNLNELADRVERVLKGRRLDGYELMLGSSRNLAIEVKEQQIDTFKCSAPFGVSVRVQEGDGQGFSYATSFTETDLQRMIDNAMVGARAQTPDRHHGFPEPHPTPHLPGLLDEQLAAIDESTKINMAMELERLTLAGDPRMKKVRKAVYSESLFTVLLRNSKGLAVQHDGSMVSASVAALAEEGGDAQMGWDFDYSTGFAGIDPARVASGAVAKAVGHLGARKIRTMHCPAILDAYVANEILEVLAPAFLAENVQKGKSLLAGKIGQQLFASSLKIRDDGTLAGGMATSPFDAEGVPHRNTVLVEDGVLKGYLYDSLCGRREGVESTGNSARGGFKSLPHMGVTNFFIEPGTTPVTALREGIGKGFLVTDVIGMHTANPISGDFSVGAVGFLIEDGAVTVPVKGVAISGNILDLFRNIEALGDDFRFFGVVGAPSLRLAGLDVSGE